MRKYYYNCPRGFSNEFSIISVEQTDPHEVQQFEEFYERYMHRSNPNWNLHQITAKRAREIIAAEKATARSYRAAGLNLHCNPVGATEITTATEYFAEY